MAKLVPSTSRAHLLDRRASTKDVATDAPGLRLVVSQNYDEMSERATILVSSRVLENPTLCFALAVGATPTGTYQRLAALAKTGVVPLNDCHFYLFDEFFSSSSASAPPSPSNAAAAAANASGAASSTASTAEPRHPHLNELTKNFFHIASIPREHIHTPDASLKPSQAVSTFQEMTNLRKLDVAVIGIGPQGQIGWLDKPDATQGVHVVDMESGTPDQNKGFSHCVTMGFQQLMSAKEIYLFAVNRNKAEIVAKVLNDKKGQTAVGWLIHNHPRVFLFLDTNAAQLILTTVKLPTVNVPGFQILNSPDSVRGKRVVCFAPHPDDTSISAGATLALLAENNDVTSCVATTGHRAYIPNTTTAEERIAIREKEATEEAALLGVRVHFLRLPLYNRSSVVADDDVKILAAYLADFKPDLIFMPQTGDTHQTHRAVAKAILLAIQRLIHSSGSSAYSVDVYMYEGPWSLFSKGAYNVIVSPSSDQFAKKLSAIQVHKSQTARTAYDRAADSLAQLRGALVPEQDLSGWGDQPPEIGDRLELFYRRHIVADDDITTLLGWLDANQPPKWKV